LIYFSFFFASQSLLEANKKEKKLYFFVGDGPKWKENSPLKQIQKKII
jgi:hypothetical protein